MKKYLPSLDEIVPGVIIVVLALVVWNLVSAPISKLTAKIAMK